MSLYEDLVAGKEKLAVIGLGYVGLPIAAAFARIVKVIGFDVNSQKIEAYQNGFDITGDLGHDVVRSCGVEFTSDRDKLAGVHCYIVAVPTPVKSGNVPDLTDVQNASRLVAEQLTPGSLVIYESTVYPGVTEEVCIPILEEVSGLTCGKDFRVGYSPERINPGDKVHRLENIVKIVSGNDEEALDTVASLYELIIDAGVHRADSIKVAEAAKVIENAQRDINIAFMNELSMLFHEMDIDTNAVLRAAGTKWNFLPFRPGLVGGHCISIDPYYLTYKAEDSGYHSKIILAGRHINDGMGKYIAQNIIKMMVRHHMDLKNTRIGILGLAFKENCSDIRNSKVVDIVNELSEYGITPLVSDPYVDANSAYKEYGVELTDLADMKELNIAVVAVAHECFKEMDFIQVHQLYSSEQPKIMIDIKGIYDRGIFERSGILYWSL
ncbi:nucleotide sugar dehydrogenase [Neobacillus mesonae]|nr:nucleotide sugar dehydrogenase [Neobacillus mesonae]